MCVEYRGNHKTSILFKQAKVDQWHPLKMPFLNHQLWRQESGLTFSPRPICLPVWQSWQIVMFQIVPLISKNKIQSGKISQRIIFISRNYSAFYTQLATEGKEPILMGACAAATWNRLPGTDRAVTTVPAFVHGRCWCCQNRGKPTIVASWKRN